MLGNTEISVTSDRGGQSAWEVPNDDEGDANDDNVNDNAKAIATADDDDATDDDGGTRSMSDHSIAAIANTIHRRCFTL
ncbi:MAG: hypothetical protein AAFN70_12210 [Planctomycetota bacterium]